MADDNENAHEGEAASSLERSLKPYREEFGVVRRLPAQGRQRDEILADTRKRGGPRATRPGPCTTATPSTLRS
jgi:hypothetical protein